jgi:hypothetical protein
LSDRIPALFAAVLLAGVTIWVAESCRVVGLDPVHRFALIGRHAPLACGECHETTLDAPVPNSCRGCHAEDAPPHHFEGDCAECHTERGWDDLDVDHSFFPLKQGHADVLCSSCHVGDYTSADPTCAACHEADRPRNHFTGACESCHDISGWDNATFDHAQYLSLQGGHAPLSCGDCHTSPGTYEGLNGACQSCHADDRPSGHYAGGCAECHNVFDWEDADFDHDRFFPTPHNGVSACADCHPGGDTNTFTCTDCHEHRKPDMDDEHRGFAGYQYDSDFCLDCHPDGDD